MQKDIRFVPFDNRYLQIFFSTIVNVNRVCFGSKVDLTPSIEGGKN